MFSVTSRRLFVARYRLKKVIHYHRLGFGNFSSRKICSLNFSQVSRLHTIGKRSAAAPTIRGWKAVGNPNLVDSDGDFIANKISCEDGTDAVPHSVLISQLNSCDTVEDQIKTLYSSLSLTAADVENRKAFCHSLAEAIKPYFAASKVHLFGSSWNGLGFRGCDVDACVQTVFNQDETDSKYAQYGDVPSLDDVLQGKVPPDIVATLHPKFKLRLVRRIFRKHCQGIREPILLIKARCPILRFYHEKYNVFCDLSCVNRFALQNTKLVRFLCHYDERFGLLAKALRYWGKNGKFVGDIERFNSHSFSLMVLYFLQNVSPPVIPPLADIINKADYLTAADVDEDEILFRNLQSIPKSQNKSSTADLLKEFFYFYLYFDFDRVMMPLTASSVPKPSFVPGEDPSTEVFEMSTISIQDPFRLSFNSTFGAEFKYCKKFLLSIRNACQLYQRTSAWQPKEGNWGLSELLESVESDLSRDTYVTDQKSISFDVPLRSSNPSVTCEKPSGSETTSLASAANVVKKILEHGLLFQCKSSIFPKTSEVDQQLLRLQCEVMNNTWVGRNEVHKELFSNIKFNNPLELEHQISTSLVQKHSGKQGSFKLVCELYGIEKDGEKHLRVVFKSQTVRIPPVVSIFLMDYIPKMLDRLL